MKKLIRFDWAIKKILRSKANFVVLEGLLSELLNDDIKIQSILESESNQETADDKFNRVDLLVKDSKNQLIIIEVQVRKQIDYLQRMAYGTAKVMTEHIKKADKYKKIKKIISINILYFDLGEGADYIYHGLTKLIGIHNNKELKLSKEQYEIFSEYYIINVNKFNDIAKNTLDQWIYFLKNEEVKKNFKAKGLKEAQEILSIMKLPEKEQKKYDRYLESLMDEDSWMLTYYEVPYEEGIKKGRKEEKEKTAILLYKENMPIKKISSITGLSEEEIKKFFE